MTRIHNYIARQYPDLVRVAPQKLASVADIWLLAHPESRHLRRIAAVYQHLADHLRLHSRQIPLPLEKRAIKIRQVLREEGLATFKGWATKHDKVKY